MKYLKDKFLNKNGPVTFTISSKKDKHRKPITDLELRLKNENIYEGQLKFQNGNTYIGTFINGELECRKIIYPNGNEYEGEWTDGKFHGRGSINIDGVRYEGKFKITNNEGDKYNVCYKGGFPVVSKMTKKNIKLKKSGPFLTFSNHIHNGTSMVPYERTGDLANKLNELLEKKDDYKIYTGYFDKEDKKVISEFLEEKSKNNKGIKFYFITRPRHMFFTILKVC